MSSEHLPSRSDLDRIASEHSAQQAAKNRANEAKREDLKRAYAVTNPEHQAVNGRIVREFIDKAVGLRIQPGLRSPEGWSEFYSGVALNGRVFSRDRFHIGMIIFHTGKSREERWGNPERVEWERLRTPFLISGWQQLEGKTDPFDYSYGSPPSEIDSNPSDWQGTADIRYTPENAPILGNMDPDDLTQQLARSLTNLATGTFRADTRKTMSYKKVR